MNAQPKFSREVDQCGSLRDQLASSRQPSLDAAESPAIRDRAEAIIAFQIAERERWAAVHQGVSWGGLSLPAPPVESIETVAARLEREDAASAAFALTPEGRFTAAAAAIFRATGDDRLLSCRSRGLAFNIDRAARVLSELHGPEAEAARRSLADFAGVR